jgi:hypothetical protein
MYTRLGYRRYGLLWPKVEILLGLAAAGAGLLLGLRSSPAVDTALTVAALSLFVLGGYLALAGHRSHLYKASNELTVYLADEIRNSKGKGPPG